MPVQVAQVTREVWRVSAGGLLVGTSVNVVVLCVGTVGRGHRQMLFRIIAVSCGLIGWGGGWVANRSRRSDP